MPDGDGKPRWVFFLLLLFSSPLIVVHVLSCTTDQTSLRVKIVGRQEYDKFGGEQPGAR